MVQYKYFCKKEDMDQIFGSYSLLNPQHYNTVCCTTNWTAVCTVLHFAIVQSAFYTTNYSTICSALLIFKLNNNLSKLKNNAIKTWLRVILLQILNGCSPNELHQIDLYRIKFKEARRRKYKS